MFKSRRKPLVILGKSGSGKSVLIKCIINLMTADEGIITVFGEDFRDLDPDVLDNMRARIGFLFQSNALYDSMTVRLLQGISGGPDPIPLTQPEMPKA